MLCRFGLGVLLVHLRPRFAHRTKLVRIAVEDIFEVGSPNYKTNNEYIQQEICISRAYGNHSSVDVWRLDACSCRECTVNF